LNPNLHVEYLRVEPPGIPTAFWRSVGPSHNVFVTESFIDELAAAAKQDAVAYRRALLDKAPRAKAVLELAAEKADLRGHYAYYGIAGNIRALFKVGHGGALWRDHPKGRTC
jgi:CO/xanthine dehydrogenase Mo-binding subunit